ncbi:unknown [Prevotella sp. CAG:1320]|nr:unknown [Prevotella sp. CAG:1320]
MPRIPAGSDPGDHRGHAETYGAPAPLSPPAALLPAPKALEIYVQGRDDGVEPPKAVSSLARLKSSRREINNLTGRAPICVSRLIYINASSTNSTLCAQPCYHQTVETHSCVSASCQVFAIGDFIRQSCLPRRKNASLQLFVELTLYYIRMPQWLAPSIPQRAVSFHSFSVSSSCKFKPYGVRMSFSRLEAIMMTRFFLISSSCL